MDRPVFRHDIEGARFRFLWDDGEIVVPDTSPDRLGRLSIEILRPKQKGHLAQDLVNLLAERDRWQIARNAERRDGTEAPVWTDRLLAVSLKLGEVAPHLLGEANRNRHSMYIGDDDYDWVSLGSKSEPPPMRYVIEGKIPDGHPTIIFADGGNAKSFLALYIALCVSSGIDFLGTPVKKQAVGYLDWELDEDETLRRAYRLARGRGFTKPPNDLFYKRCFQSLPDSLADVSKFVEEHEIGLLIVDSFGPAAGGDPENTSLIIGLFNSLRSLKCTPLLIDHQSKHQTGDKYEAKSPFGSAYKFNMARSVFQARRVAWERDQNRIGVMLRHAKANFAAPLDNITLWITFDESITIEEAQTGDKAAFEDDLPADAKVEEALAGLGKATYAQLAEETGLNEGTVKNACQDLRARGSLEEAGKEGRRKLIQLKKEAGSEES